MKKTILSPRQLMILTSGLSYGSVTLTLPSGIAKLAGPDVWLSLLIGTAIGLLFLWVIAKLGELNPDKTFVEIIQHYLGKWAGGLVAAFFILTALVAADQIVWYIGNFAHTEFRPELPVLPLNIFL